MRGCACAGSLVCLVSVFLLSVQTISGQSETALQASHAFSKIDLNKCTAGYRDFCPPIVRCWIGVIEVACDGPDSDSTLHGAWIQEPPFDLLGGEEFSVGWEIDFKNRSEGGALASPWVSHTNVHIAPANVGALAPPTNHPLRKDSESLVGGVGTYWSNMTLSDGVWLIMAHIRIEDERHDGSQQYEMTVDIVRTVGNAYQAQVLEETESKATVERFCSIFGNHMFRNCDDFRRAWIASISGVIAIFFLIWFQSFFFVAHMSFGGLSLRMQAKKITLLRFSLSIVLAAAVVTTNNEFLQQWIHTNREPSRTTKKSDESLRFPNVLLCPFTSTGVIKVLSTVHYPNLYGLSALNVKHIEDYEIDLVDRGDGTEIRRQCAILDMSQHHQTEGVNVSSEFTTLMVKTIVTDPVRADSGGFGDAMAVMFEERSELQEPRKFTVNQILMGQTFATYATLSPQKFTDITGNVTSSFAFTTNAITNPYLRHRDELCVTSDSMGVCDREAVLVLTWKTLQTEEVREETTLKFFTVCTLMVGVISGCRMLLEVVSNLLDYMWHDANRDLVHYFIGHHEPDPIVPDVHLGRRRSSIGRFSLPESASGDIPFEFPPPPPSLTSLSAAAPRRASLSEIVAAVRDRKVTNEGAKTAERLRRESFTPSCDGAGVSAHVVYPGQTLQPIPPSNPVLTVSNIPLGSAVSSATPSASRGHSTPPASPPSIIDVAIVESSPVPLRTIV